MSGHGPSAEDVQEEQAHFRQVVTTFRQYRQYSLSANIRRRKDFYSLPLPHQKLLREVGWYQKLGDVDDAILVNADFLEQIVDDTEIFAGSVDDLEEASTGGEQEEASSSDAHPHAEHTHEHGAHGHSHGRHSHGHAHTHERVVGSSSVPAHEHRQKVSEPDMDKLRSTLKQFVRDWSAEGKKERDEQYEPILQALEEHFKDIPEDGRSDIQVLVPGAGLGRLTWEVVNRGFSCQGNEFSYFMLLSSFFMLNRSPETNKWTIYPHIHSLSNLQSEASLLQPIMIPDVLPGERKQGPDFSQVAGDFEEVYGLGARDQAEAWDAVLTCFFIDTAKNIVSYLEIIRHLLTPGGVWINLGPLLWHFENNSTKDVSIELNLAEVKVLAEKMGFKIENERMIETTYVGHEDAMLHHVYNCAFWTATKIK
ncbi:N2227-domain-containing protein [Dacryopinax primogenitus]|uniref:carnosine N-methyltransferase n=1 Tax=Dacryopinax primogenitus (strain DJM 731) TaxID=1858805 RepID=M5FXX7_DACPD|nr:N2227-domain-containing protein [Dacryopinax primogenitus]EJU01374.1 N2227-domain-containing protein [Dacryopinax primogenitus]